MTIFEWVILGWAAGLTIWMFYFKKGPKGDSGYDNFSSITTLDIKDASLEMINESDYMTKLIKAINSYQLHGGAPITKDHKP